MSSLVCELPDQSSMTSPTGMPPIAFFASSIGPGQATPRASTTMGLAEARELGVVQHDCHLRNLLVDERVRRRHDLGHEAARGHDMGAFDEVCLDDPAALDARRADEERPAEVTDRWSEARASGLNSGAVTVSATPHFTSSTALALEPHHHLDVGGGGGTGHDERDASPSPDRPGPCVTMITSFLLSAIVWPPAGSS